MWYNDLHRNLQQRFGCNVRKICLDGGTTCPNRDGTKARGGCLFCGAQGAGENLSREGTLSEQLAAGMRTIRRRDPQARAIAYFQNFSATYAPVDVLRQHFLDAAHAPGVAVLAVATRPDCLSEAHLALLNEVHQKTGVEVWVELGLQTSDDALAARMNRCCPTAEFDRVAARLAATGIQVIVHLLFGLPGESEAGMLASVRHAAQLPISGIKFHALYVMRDAPLAAWYAEGRYTPLTFADYLRVLGRALPLIPREVVVHRLASDCRRDQLVAPAWCGDRPRIRREILDYLTAQQCVQGSACD
mgnify:CR=1 FL=1